MWLARARVSPASALDQGDHRRRLALAYASLRCTVSRGSRRYLHLPASCAARRRSSSCHCTAFPLGAQPRNPARNTQLLACGVSQHQLRPHIDGSDSPSNGVRQARVAHFTPLCRVALSDVPTDFGQRHSVARRSSALRALLSDARRARHAARQGAPRPSRPNWGARARRICRHSRGPACPRRPSRYAGAPSPVPEHHDPDALDILADIWREFAVLLRLPRG